MSTALLFDGIARIARHEAAARPVASVGVVTSIYGNDGSSPDHAVSVKLRESGLVLPRVPIAVGAFGMAAIPSVGELVLITFLEGDYNAPVVIGRLYHPDQNPPKHDEQQIVLRLPVGQRRSGPELRDRLRPGEGHADHAGRRLAGDQGRTP